jgi:hypothetical protein
MGDGQKPKPEIAGRRSGWSVLAVVHIDVVMLAHVSEDRRWSLRCSPLGPRRRYKEET